jgi:sporulation protein YlmC with PRC-barrel domain
LTEEAHSSSILRQFSDHDGERPFFLGTAPVSLDSTAPVIGLARLSPRQLISSKEDDQVKLTTLCTVIVALSLGAGAPSCAQPPAKSPARPAVLADHSLRASKLLNAPVYNAKGEEIGTIDDILVDPKTGEARAVLAIGNYIGTANAMVAVPLSSVQIGAGHHMMPEATKDSLATMTPWTYRSDLEGGGH